MKKQTLVFGITLSIIGLITYGFINWNDSKTAAFESSVGQDIASNMEGIEKVESKIFSDFIYDVGPRFGFIKKAEVDKATTIEAFMDKEEFDAIVAIKSVSVIIIIDDKRSDIREIGYSSSLTEAQLNLLQSADYGTNIMISAEYHQLNTSNNKLENNHITPHRTIVPEKQASYVDGKDALKKYLRENSEAARANVDPEKLQPAKLFFTVTAKGTIENIRLDRPSGYPLVDKTMIELITKAPGVWEPAENTKGEKVNQELVVSFGLIGC